MAEFTFHQTNKQTVSFEPRDFYNDNFHLFFIPYLILVLREKLYASPIHYGRFYGKIIQEKRLSKNKTFD